MKKLVLLLALLSFAIAQGPTIESRVGTIEEVLKQKDNIEKQNDEFYEFQKGLNLENKKMLNECQVSINDFNKMITKVNSNIVSPEDIGKLKSKVSSLETTVSRQDDKIYKLEQKLINLERRVK